MARTSNATTAPSPPHTQASTPIDLLDVMLVEEVSEPLWRQIFDVIGYPTGMSARTFKVTDLVDHLGRVDLSDDLLDLLRAINDLGTDEGADTIKAVADEHQVDLGAVTAHAPRDAAAALWLAQRVNPVLREVYAHIQMQADARRSPRSFREFRGDEARRIPGWGDSQATSRGRGDGLVQGSAVRRLRRRAGSRRGR